MKEMQAVVSDVNTRTCEPGAEGLIAMAEGALYG